MKKYFLSFAVLVCVCAFFSLAKTAAANNSYAPCYDDEVDNAVLPDCSNGSNDVYYTNSFTCGQGSSACTGTQYALCSPTSSYMGPWCDDGYGDKIRASVLTQTCSCVTPPVTCTDTDTDTDTYNVGDTISCSNAANACNARTTGTETCDDNGDGTGSFSACNAAPVPTCPVVTPTSCPAEYDETVTDQSTIAAWCNAYGTYCSNGYGSLSCSTATGYWGAYGPSCTPAGCSACSCLPPPAVSCTNSSGAQVGVGGTQSCSNAANACNSATSGTETCQSTGSWSSCSAASVPALPTGYGTSCGGSSCVNAGTVSCSGTCTGTSAIAPGTGTCPATCASDSGQSCSNAGNACSSGTTGTYSCSGVCSAASVPALPTGYGTSCGGSSCVNAGTVSCSGTCTGTSNVAYGTSCGGTNICNGSGSCVAAPPESSCTINSFTASPASIASGGSSNLSWSTSNCSSAAISPGVGVVSAGSGTVAVYPGSTTTYTLTASDGTNSPTATSTVTVTSIPPSPSGSSTSNYQTSDGSVACNSIQVGWDSVSGADSYAVYRSTSNTVPGSPWQSSLPGTSYSYSDSTNTAYYYWVAAHGSGGYSSASQATPAPISSTPCEVNLGSSTKTFIAVQPGGIGSFEPIGSASSVNAGDVVEAQVQLVNSGSQDANNVAITDLPTNLTKPTNFTLNGSPWSVGTLPSSGSFTLPTIAKVAAGTTTTITFDETVTPPSGSQSGLYRFSNAVDVSSSPQVGSNCTSATSGQCSIASGSIPFQYGNGGATIHEVAP